MSSNPISQPMQAAQQVMGAMSVDPRPTQRSSTFMNANEGPAAIISKVAGVTGPGNRADDAPYFTNNEGNPWPSAIHSKNVGGIPLVSDPFLLQKQQTFNRSKTLESE